MTQAEIYRAVLQKTGLPAQLRKMYEECGELADAIAAGGGVITPAIAEELADVVIVAGVLAQSFYAPAIACAKRYKLRRMSAFLRGNCKTWAQFKRRAYPGFAEKKTDMLLTAAGLIANARALEKKTKGKNNGI